MDRRGFLRSLLGVAAGAALPSAALDFLARNTAIADEAFRDQAIIELLKSRIAEMQPRLCRALAESLYSTGTISNDTALLFSMRDDMYAARGRSEWTEVSTPVVVDK